MWKRFFANKGAFAGLILIVLLSLFSLAAPHFSPFEYDEVDVAHQHQPPRIPILEKYGIFDGKMDGIDYYEDSRDVYHYFGTDTLGRDLWTRVFLGTRVSLYIAVLSVLIEMTIGIIYGVTAGYYGGGVDIVMQRILEIIQGIPTIVLVTLLMMVLKPGLITITVALVMAGWINMSLLVRSQVLKLKEMEYVLSARTLGQSDPSIIFGEILPNAAGQVVIMAMMSIPQAIFLEAYLSFMGLGIPDPMASLGSLINTGFSSMLLYPYMVLIPVIVFIILVVSFNLVADGLRDALDNTMETIG